VRSSATRRAGGAWRELPDRVLYAVGMAGPLDAPAGYMMILSAYTAPWSQDRHVVGPDVSTTDSS
jgi:hypothetical protein